MTNAPRIQTARVPVASALPSRKCHGPIPSERLNDWGEPEQKTASNTNDERESEDAGVYREVNNLRNHERVEQRRADACDEQRSD